MIRGIIGSLIAAAVFFAAGEITIKVLGTKGLGGREFEDMELFSDAPELTELVSEGKFVGERTWEFDAAGTLGIFSDRANTKVRRVDGDKVTLKVKTDGARNATVAVSGSEDGGYLGICVRENGGLAFWNSGNTRVEIGLPDKVLEGLELRLGSGELKASEMKAGRQVVDVSSGRMEFSHAADCEAAELSVSLHSGKFYGSEIKARKAEVDVGSGIMEFRQTDNYNADELTLSLSSGELTASYIRAAETTIEVDSGVLKYSQVEQFRGERLSLDIGSGHVTLKNCDTAEYEISMGSGSFDVSGLTGTGEIDIGSGSGSADFAAIDRRGSNIDISSGSLKVYLPRDSGAEVVADISSGSVSLDCYGASGKLKDGEMIVLGEGGGRFTVDISSGKVSFLDSKKHTAEHAAQITDYAVIQDENTDEYAARVPIDAITFVEEKED